MASVSLDYLVGLVGAVPVAADEKDAAEKMRKPLVLEEFGLARDESALHPGTPTDRRDEWFMAVCNEVAARTPARTPLRAEELPPRGCRCSH